MLTRARRLPLLALLFALASPGLGGVAVQLLHDCPVDAPWTAGQSESHSSHGGERGDSGPGHHGSCQCLGHCLVPSGSVPPTPPQLVVRIALPVAPIAGVRLATFLPHSQPTDRLPPSTAPPLA